MNSCFLASFSGGQKCEIGLAKFQGGIHDELAFLRGTVIVGWSDAIDEPMGAQQAELASDVGSSAPVLGGIVFRREGEGGPQVEVADPLEVKFSAQDSGKQTALLGTNGLQGAITSGGVHGLSNGIEKAMRGLRVTHHRQGLQIAGIGAAAQLHAPAQVHDALAERVPAFHLATLPPHAAVDAKPRRIIEGGFHPQHAALLVVHLDRVPFHSMLHAHPFHPSLVGAANFAVKQRVGASPKKRSTGGEENCSRAWRHRAG